MAVNINGRMAVKTLQKEFKKEFGLTLRIYDGKSFADESSTLASIRKGDKKGGEFSPRKNMKVGNVEEKFMDLFEIKVQVAGSDNSYLCDDDLTLAAATETDEKKMGRKAKKAERNASADAKESDSSATKEEDVETGTIVAVGIGTGGGTDEHTWAEKLENDYSDKDKFKVVVTSLRFDADEDFVFFEDILDTELNNVEIFDGGDDGICIVWDSAQIILKVSEDQEDQLVMLKMDDIPIELSYAVIKRDLDAEFEDEPQENFEVLDEIEDRETASFCEWEILEEW